MSVLGGRRTGVGGMVTQRERRDQEGEGEEEEEGVQQQWLKRLV